MPTVKEKNMMNSPLKTAKGLGSAHHGVEHWLSQKITALANLPLVLWFICSTVSLYAKGASYEAFTAWVAQPLNTTLLVAMFISVFYHAKLGAQVVTEDYVSCGALKKAKLIAQKLFFALITVASIVCVLKIAFTAGM